MGTDKDYPNLKDSLSWRWLEAKLHQNYDNMGTTIRLILIEKYRCVAYPYIGRAYSVALVVL